MATKKFLHAGGTIPALIALLAGLALPVQADQGVEDGWIPVATTPSGRIFQRVVAGSAFPWVMIETTFAAPPARVHALVTDYDHFAGFIPNVVESRVLAREDAVQWVYHHLHFPGPVADRVYIFRSSGADNRPAADYYREAWQLATRRFPAVDLSAGVVPEVFSGYWELQPAEQAGTTHARYAVYSDPGGFLPGWLIGEMTNRYVRQVVEAIRTRLAIEAEAPPLHPPDGGGEPAVQSGAAE